MYSDSEHVIPNTLASHVMKTYYFFLASREMISIMQEYGEVVCCIGSSLNVDNLEIFNQADIRWRSLFLFNHNNHADNLSFPSCFTNALNTRQDFKTKRYVYL